MLSSMKPCSLHMHFLSMSGERSYSFTLRLIKLLSGECVFRENKSIEVRLIDVVRVARIFTDEFLHAGVLLLEDLDIAINHPTPLDETFLLVVDQILILVQLNLALDHFIDCLVGPFDEVIGNFVYLGQDLKTVGVNVCWG